ncbi:hypothetical protein OsJ_18162 [Oryza sativa Japonica Group]|uniref:Phospholipase A1 n=1 Tax=Oryza sativa subsp. japonica TaxID=39947 RepID=B9FP12_ORYSJ|nr:hypothetical protein OsJ_18162 [Oryza sativa Japonica Group]
MAQATYDAFNREKLSPHAGLSRFAIRRFFEWAQLRGHAAAYRVTRFLYATSCVAVPVLSEVARLVSMYQDEELSITATGHNLGAALATLNAFDIVANGYNRHPGHRVRIRQPARRRARLQESLRRRTYSTAPPNRGVGTELAIDTGESPYLRRLANELVWHKLDSYLHGVAGARGGEAGRFKLAANAGEQGLRRAGRGARSKSTGGGERG